MGPIEYKGYQIRQGNKDRGNNAIGVFKDGKLVDRGLFKYPAYNLLERSKRIQKAKDFIDNLEGSPSR